MYSHGQPGRRRYSLKKFVIYFFLLFIFFMVAFYCIAVPRLWSSLHQNMRNIPTRENQHEKLLTLFTTVLPADDDPLRQMAQENCLKLLSKLEDTNVIVFTNYKYWIQFSRSLGLYVITNVKSNEYGTPFLKDMFLTSMQSFNSMFYGYLNADILFDDTLTDSLKSVQQSILTKQLSERVYIVGQRTNVQQTQQDSYNYDPHTSNNAFVTAMLLDGHRYWDSAIDYQIVTMKTFNFEEIPDFIIGRAGYDIWLVDYVVCHPEIVMVDTTNAIHCVHLLSKEGNRSGIKRNTPDKEYNRQLGNTYDCKYTHFGYYSDSLLVKYQNHYCIAPHLFQGYFDDTYYEPELQMIEKYTAPLRERHPIACLLITEGDVLGLVQPYCDSLTIIVINPESCERVQKRFESCRVDVDVGCAKGNISKKQFSVPLFYKITEKFDFILLHSAKPLSLMFWIKNQIKSDGVLLMRHWLEPKEQEEITRSLATTFRMADLLTPPPEFDKTHDPHYGMVVFQHL